MASLRDLNKKFDKFMMKKKQTPVKPKNAKGSLTPHITYGLTSPTTAASTKRPTSRQFSMTLSFFNPKFEKTYPQDFVIRHEDLKQKALLIPNSARYASPKRDPILQNNSEGVHEFKPSFKRHPESDRMALFTEEAQYSSKIKGEYNPLTNTRSLSPRIEGIRCGLAPHRDSSQDVVRRQLRHAGERHKNKPNPITEGDLAGIKLIKVRSEPEILEETKRLNARKIGLAADRGASKRGRVFWDSKVQLNTDRTEADDESQRYPSPRPLHKHARGDDMRESIEYASALPYRDQGVSAKVNSGPMIDLMKVKNENLEQ